MRHIVLILADANRFRIDLDKLRQRILKPPRDRHGAAQGHVVFGKLLGPELRRRIDGRAGLVDHHIGKATVKLADQFGREQLAFLGGRPVADGEHLDPVLFDERAEHALCFCHLVLRRGGIDDRGIEHLTGRVDDGDFAAGSVGRVDGQHRLAFDGRLHQQRFEVDAKIFDRLFVGSVGQLCAQLAFKRRVDQALIRVGDGRQHGFGRYAPLFDEQAR